MHGLRNSFPSVLAFLGVIACFFFHVPAGPYATTNGPAADERAWNSLDWAALPITLASAVTSIAMVHSNGPVLRISAHDLAAPLFEMALRC
jgi:hypothetical protein